MSLVFEALRGSGTDLPGTPSASGSVLARPRVRHTGPVLMLMLVVTGLAGTRYLMGAPEAVVAPTATPTVPTVPTVHESVSAPTVISAPGTAHRPGQATPATVVTPAPQPVLVAVRPVALAPAAAPRPAMPAAAATTASAPARTVAATAPARQQAPVKPARTLAAFNTAMAQGQPHRAQAILQQAEADLGDSHLLVLRMRGYYCMRADCQPRARLAYETILTRLPRDRDAGYNLALLDWQAGRLAQARQRINTLLQHHPGDRALQALQQATGAHP